MPSRTRQLLTRTITIAASAAGALLFMAGPAQAHVGVIGDVIPGEPATLQFRVPSELADATTVRVVVSVPPELDVTSVPDHVGWSHETVSQTVGDGVQVVWTAKPGHDIQPGESETFPVEVGPVPDQYSATFIAEQLYSDGTVAVWDEEQTGSEEPEFPAPVLLINPEAEQLAGAGTGDHRQEADAAGTDSADTVPDADAAEVSSETEQRNSTPGLIAGAGAGVVVGAVVTATLLRRRQNTAAPGSVSQQLLRDQIR